MFILRDKVVEYRKAKESFPPGTLKNGRNELRKLRATYYNNTAVGLTVAGSLIPFILILPNIINFFKESITAGEYWRESPKELLFPLLLAVFAIGLARIIRAMAENFLLTMED